MWGRFDANANFTDKTSTTWVGVTCAVCHDPHGSSNPAQLTQPINTLDTTSNLCMRCHYRRSVPDQSSSRGPHAPQGPTLLGISGWQPAGFTWSSAQQPTHANPTANPGLCAGCHVYKWSAKDTQTGKTVYTVGHRFAATPCATPGGAPDTTSACADSLKSFISCTQSGCHSSQAAARGALEAVNGRMQFYANVLWIDKNGNGTVDTTDGGLLAQVKKLKPGDWKTNDNLITVAEGAQFNVSLVTMPGQGAHNPFYLEALMVATINAVQTTYGVAAPPAVQQYIATRQAAMRSRQ